MDKLSSKLGNGFIVGTIIFLIGIAAMMLIVTYLTALRKRKYVEEKEEVEQYSKKLKETLSPEESKITISHLNGDLYVNQTNSEIDENSIKENPHDIDVLRLMLVNLENIKEFYTWSQRQAKSAFSLAVSMCIGGFVMMTAAIMLPIVFGLNLEMAIIPAIGGAIAELVAGTALFVYKNSLSQLNHYHKALHEDERFLSSVNLLSRFSTTETQDEMLKEIIRSEIQMNVLSVSNAEDKIDPQKKSDKKEDGKNTR